MCDHLARLDRKESPAMLETPEVPSTKKTRHRHGCAALLRRVDPTVQSSVCHGTWGGQARDHTKQVISGFEVPRRRPQLPTWCVTVGSWMRAVAMRAIPPSGRSAGCEILNARPHLSITARIAAVRGRRSAETHASPSSTIAVVVPASGGHHGVPVISRGSCRMTPFYHSPDRYDSRLSLQCVLRPVWQRDKDR